jgi:hypothetical protein
MLMEHLKYLCKHNTKNYQNFHLGLSHFHFIWDGMNFFYKVQFIGIYIYNKFIIKIFLKIPYLKKIYFK